MNDVRMWVVVFWAAVLVALLLAYARGPEHHRGDDVGALATPYAVSHGLHG